MPSIVGNLPVKQAVAGCLQARAAREPQPVGPLAAATRLLGSPRCGSGRTNGGSCRTQLQRRFLPFPSAPPYGPPRLAAAVGGQACTTTCTCCAGQAADPTGGEQGHRGAEQCSALHNVPTLCRQRCKAAALLYVRWIHGGITACKVFNIAATCPGCPGRAACCVAAMRMQGLRGLARELQAGRPSASAELRGQSLPQSLTAIHTAICSHKLAVCTDTLHWLHYLALFGLDMHRRHLGRSALAAATEARRERLWRAGSGPRGVSFA